MQSSNKRSENLLQQFLIWHCDLCLQLISNNSRYNLEILNSVSHFLFWMLLPSFHHLLCSMPLFWQKTYVVAEDHKTTWPSLKCSCGSVGRAVASDSRGLQFESSHRQNFILNELNRNLIRLNTYGFEACHRLM